MGRPKFKKLILHTDSRGRLVEIVRPEDVPTEGFGQITMTTAVKGETKGKHYHKRKTEWYCVIQGRAKLLLRSNKTGEELTEELAGDNLQLVEIPPDWYHKIANTGKGEMILLIYCNESFDQTDSDTYYE